MKYVSMCSTGWVDNSNDTITATDYNTSDYAITDWTYYATSSDISYIDPYPYQPVPQPEPVKEPEPDTRPMRAMRLGDR